MLHVLVDQICNRAPGILVVLVEFMNLLPLNVRGIQHLWHQRVISLCCPGRLAGFECGMGSNKGSSAGDGTNLEQK